MVATTKGRKPLNILMCEIVYTAIVVNRPKFKSTRDTIYDFIQNSKTFKVGLQEGKLHNDFIAEVRSNNMQHPTQEVTMTELDMRQIELDRDVIMKQVARVADPGDRSEKTSTGLSDRAYKQIWRMCQSYEEYCIETNQPGPLPLNIIKQDQN